MVNSADASIPTRNNKDVCRRGMPAGFQYLRLSGPKPRSPRIYTLLEEWHMGMGWIMAPPEVWGGPAGWHSPSESLAPLQAADRVLS